MNVNLIFENVKAYDVTKFDVKLLQDFDIELVNTDESTILKWFSNNDDILAIKVSPDGYSAKLKATSKGSCEIQIQNSQNLILKTLLVEVYDVIAVALNPAAGNPVLK
jgi:hypothetical protein